MLPREAIRDVDRFAVLDLGGEPAAALRIGVPLPLLREVPFGARHGVARLTDGQLRLHHRLPHLPRQITQITRRRRRIERGAQRVPQALEHATLAFPDCLREKRREHLFHRLRLARGTGRRLATVLLDPLLLGEARVAFRATVFVDRHGGVYVIPRSNSGQVDARPRRADDCVHAESPVAYGAVHGSPLL